MPKLYLVATPIGNLEDITLRALQILKRVDFVLCEDTRVSAKLLKRFNIEKPLVSFYEHTKLEKIKRIIGQIRSSDSAVLITDAGTPGISDPGGRLIEEILASEDNNIEIIPVPGASALTAAASVSGLPMNRFLFLGFPPHKKGRQNYMRVVAESVYPVIYYESPNRLVKNLELLAKFSPKARIVLCREMTKVHEQILRGEIGEIIAYFRDNPDKLRGEFVIVVKNPRLKGGSARDKIT